MTAIQQQNSAQQCTTANVDSEEIDKFSQLAHKWWDKDSEFKP